MLGAVASSASHSSRWTRRSCILIGRSRATTIVTSNHPFSAPRNQEQFPTTARHSPRPSGPRFWRSSTVKRTLTWPYVRYGGARTRRGKLLVFGVEHVPDRCFGRAKPSTPTNSDTSAEGDPRTPRRRTFAGLDLGHHQTPWPHQGCVVSPVCAHRHLLPI